MVCLLIVRYTSHTISQYKNVSDVALIQTPGLLVVCDLTDRHTKSETNTFVLKVNIAHDSTNKIVCDVWTIADG